jgi:hypothetical protein
VQDGFRFSGTSREQAQPTLTLTQGFKRLPNNDTGLSEESNSSRTRNGTSQIRRPNVGALRLKIPLRCKSDDGRRGLKRRHTLLGQHKQAKIYATRNGTNHLPKENSFDSTLLLSNRGQQKLRSDTIAQMPKQSAQLTSRPVAQNRNTHSRHLIILQQALLERHPPFLLRNFQSRD